MLCELDGALMTTREALHDHLAAQLSLPEWYGRNLDALYDLLAGMNDVTFSVTHVSFMLDALGEYAWMMLRTLIDAVSANPTMKITISE